METKDFYCDFVLSRKVEVRVESETANVLAFHHTKPNWDFHVVLIPKSHITRLADLEDVSLISEIFAVAKRIILKFGLHTTSYKIIKNGGSFQESQHLHFHLVSGKPHVNYNE